MNRIKLGKMRERAFKIAAIFVIMIGMLAPLTSVGAKGGTSYSFIFVGPNVTMHEGDRIYIQGVMDIQPGSHCIVTGAGTFDPSTGAVSGGGIFMHINYDGKLYCIGTWKLTKFLTFDSGKLLVLADFKRVYSPIPGYPPMDLGELPLEISNNGWKMGPLFNVIESGHVFFHPHG
jgi:hypothetical protein